MTNKDRVLRFIDKHKIDLSGSGSNLNGNFATLGGFADHFNIKPEELVEIVSEKYSIEEDDLLKVAIFAKRKNYGNKWELTDEELFN